MFSGTVALFSPLLSRIRDFSVPCPQLVLRGLETESGEWVQEDSGLWGGEQGLCPAETARRGAAVRAGPGRDRPARPESLSLSCWHPRLRGPWQGPEPAFSRDQTQSPALRGPLRVSMATPLFFFVPVEGLKVVEIEKCKSDIKKMREELVARSSR